MLSDLAAAAQQAASELEAEAHRMLELAARLRERAAEQPVPHMQQPTEPSRLLTAREAADLLGITPKRLYDLAAQPDGPPHVRLGQRSMRWPLRALEEWIERRAQAETR